MDASFAAIFPLHSDIYVITQYTIKAFDNEKNTIYNCFLAWFITTTEKLILMRILNIRMLAM